MCRHLNRQFGEPYSIYGQSDCGQGATRPFLQSFVAQIKCLLAAGEFYRAMPVQKLALQYLSQVALVRRRRWYGHQQQQPNFDVEGRLMVNPIGIETREATLLCLDDVQAFQVSQSYTGFIVHLCKKSLGTCQEAPMSRN